MEHIKDELDKYLKRNGLYQMAESSNICNIFEEIKYKILNKKIVCNAYSFKEGVLKITAPSSIISTEIRIKSDDIKKKLNKKLRSDLIKKIEVIIKS
jgi:hypothetical protein